METHAVLVYLVKLETVFEYYSLLAILTEFLTWFQIVTKSKQFLGTLKQKNFWNNSNIYLMHRKIKSQMIATFNDLRISLNWKRCDQKFLDSQASVKNDLQMLNFNQFFTYVSNYFFSGSSNDQFRGFSLSSYRWSLSPFLTKTINSLKRALAVCHCLLESVFQFCFG